MTQEGICSCDAAVIMSLGISTQHW